MVQAVLRPPTDGPHLPWLTLLASAQFLAHFGRGRVMLGAFHQQPAGVGIAALGDAPLAPFVTGSISCRDQAPIGHHLAGLSEAIYLSQLAPRDLGPPGLQSFHIMEPPPPRAKAPFPNQ